jgi:hypothetical protein
MKRDKISASRIELVTDKNSSCKVILPGEVEGVFIEYVSLKGGGTFRGFSKPQYYDVILFFKGSGKVRINDHKYRVEGIFIVRIPYKRQYSIHVKQGEEIHFLRIRKSLDNNDLRVISQNKREHSRMFIKSLDECQVYTEDIKSSKSLNRMILPEGMVPRFCMGCVETAGPDSVAEHEHSMLDQLIFGLEDCKCTCIADGNSTLLLENMLLHIPLGSKHSVSVADGDRLAYVWFDFFLTLEGQKYMISQHHVDEEE